MQIAAGAVFRSTGLNAFGRPNSVTWRVMDIRRAIDGHDYALLSRTADHSHAKLVAIAALADRHLYERVQEEEE